MIFVPDNIAGTVARIGFEGRQGARKVDRHAPRTIAGVIVADLRSITASHHVAALNQIDDLLCSNLNGWVATIYGIQSCQPMEINRGSQCWISSVIPIPVRPTVYP